MPWTSHERPSPADGRAAARSRAAPSPRAPAGRAALIDGPTGRAVGYDTARGADRGGRRRPRRARVRARRRARAVGAERAARGRAWRSAAMAAGGAVTGIHPAAAEAEWRASSRDRRARARLRAGGGCEAAAALAGGRELVVLGDGDGATPVAGAASAAPAPAVAPRRAAVALLPCSSGTTGLPKAVMLTHANLAAGVAPGRARARASGARHGARAGAVRARHGLRRRALPRRSRAGATVVTLPRFDLARAARRCSRATASRCSSCRRRSPRLLAAPSRGATARPVGARAGRLRRRAARAGAAGAARRPLPARGGRPGLRA